MRAPSPYRGVWLATIVVALVAATLGALWYKGRPHGAPTSSRGPGSSGSTGPRGPATTERRSGQPRTPPVRPSPPPSGGPRGGGMYSGMGGGTKSGGMPGMMGAGPPSGGPGGMGGGMGMGSRASPFGGGQREGQEAAATCMTQVQRLARAVGMYDVDYDDHLPLAQRWSDGTYPYLLQRTLYCCPARPDVPGYAFNRSLAGTRVRDARNTSTLVMLFDSSMGKPNAADTGQSLCRPPRHAGANSIGYLDGHAILSGAPNRAAFRWR